MYTHPALFAAAAVLHSVASGSVRPVDRGPPGPSVHGALQARILEWVAMTSSRDLPDPGMEPKFPALQADSLPLSHLGIQAVLYKYCL